MLEGLALDHIGIVVRDIEEGSSQIIAGLPVVGATERFDDPGLGVSVRFFRDRSGLVFELIAPLADDSPIQNALAQRHRLNQLAYRCSDLDDTARALRRARAIPIGRPKPAIAFSGAFVQFLWSPMGFVIELIESDECSHRFSPLTRD